MRAWIGLPVALVLLVATSGTTSAAPSRPCSSGQLSVAPVFHTGAMGDELIVFRLRNRGAGCDLRGYPRVRAEKAAGAPLDLRRLNTRRPFPGGRRFPLRTVRLDRRGTAYFDLGYRNFDYPRDRECEPTVPAVEVAPPAGGRWRTVRLPFAIAFCGHTARISPVVARRP